MAMATEDVTTSYIIDLIALERDLHRSLTGHVAVGATRFGTPVFETLRATCEAHLEKLEDAVATKRQFADILVFGRPNRCFTLDTGRCLSNGPVATKSLPRELHDDCMALALTKVGYLMLNTAAVATGDDSLAVLAQSHHTAYEILEHALVRLIPAAIQRGSHDYQTTRANGLVAVSMLPS